MAIPQTEHKESLQTLAFAMRQEKGSDITYDEIRSLMMSLTVLIEPSVRRSCRIDYTKMNRDFARWVQDANTRSEIKLLDDWINSSMWIANAMIPQRIGSSGYVYFQSGELPEFRRTFIEICKRIRDSAVSPKVRMAYKIMATGTGDKWNPADVLAVRTGKASTIDSDFASYARFRPTDRQIQEFDQKNRELNSTMKKPGEKRSMNLIRDMNILYYYNKFINDNYDSKDCIPISLKKVEAEVRRGRDAEPIPAAPPVRVVPHDFAETKGIEEALDLEIEIGEVEYKVATGKCIVHFILAGETGHSMEIRSTQTEIKDVQMQLQRGRVANHGKATLPVFSLITHLSKGGAAIRAQRAKKKELFPTTRFPRVLMRQRITHSFSSSTIFDNYHKNAQGAFSRDTLLSHSIEWIQYIEWLSRFSRTRNTIDEITTQFNRKFGTNNYKAAAKYLKDKVQSYEVGMVLDQSRTEISEFVKTNIMKSVYTQAASKGFRIFGDDEIVDYMTSSSYLKVGG